jgi:hypothetical protein
MKNPEDVMEILEAYDLTGSFRAAAGLVGCDHKTRRVWVRQRDEAGRMPVVERSRPAMEVVFAAKVDELVDRSHGLVRGDVAHEKLVAIGYVGSERTTRRWVADAKRRWRRKHGRPTWRWIRSRGCGYSGTERREAFWSRAVVRDRRGGPVAAGSCELGAACPVETVGYGRQAAATTTERISTIRWSGSGKRDGMVYERNLRLNAPQEHPPARNLTDLDWAEARVCASVRRTSGRFSVAGRKATVKVWGVVVARLQGHSWAPNLTNGSRVNAGTIPAVP